MKLTKYLIFSIVILGSLLIYTTPNVVANQPPVAIALPENQTVYVGENASFIGNLSSDPDGFIVLYEWDFGDGNTSNQTNPSIIYTVSGFYTVWLTVTDNESATDSTYVNVTVLNPTSNEPPVAIAEPSDQTVYIGENASFNGSNSYDPDGYIVTYDWDFGDGNTSNQINTSHIYNVSGFYNVSLTVIDNLNDTDICYINVTVLDPPSNEPPVAVAEPDNQTVYIGENASFNGSNSYDPDGYIVSYDWDFGDGNFSIGANVSHIYTVSGNYMVRLTVTDNLSATSNVTVNVTVQEPPPPNQPPVADAEPIDQTVYTGEEASFNGSNSYDPDGFIVFYAWDFGDGNFSIGANVSHIYTVSGNYMVRLTVTDNLSATSNVTVNVTVQEPPPPNQPPVADAEPIDQTVYIDQVTWFNGSSSFDPDGYIISYEWDFGDGNVSSGANVSHIYDIPGYYNISLTVTDDSYATDICYLNVTVLDLSQNEPPIAVVEPSNQTVYVGENASFDGSGSYDPDGQIVSYEWDFGDGNFGSGISSSHVFIVSGNYNVSLTITDDSNATDICYVNVMVLDQPENEPPVAIIDLHNQTGYVGDEVWFNGSGSYDPDGQIISYEWDFGDGNVSSLANVLYVYNISGNYTVILTVTDNQGGTDQQIVFVTVEEPENDTSGRKKSKPSSEYNWWIIAVITGIFTGLVAVNLTEVGKYKFLLLFLPLYTRLNKEEILDQYTRGKIHGYILANPGDHYNSIKKALNMSNGMFAYHLRVLEKERMIKSKRDGKYKRFYPYEMQIPTNGGRLKESQRLIIEKIQDTPGISQKEIASLLGVSASTINYHINELIKLDIVISERKGMRLKYYVDDEQLIKFRNQ